MTARRTPTKRPTRASETRSKACLTKPLDPPLFAQTVEATGFNPDTPLVLPYVVGIVGVE